ncbi:MAG TPA: TonB family protein [Verrucomicrobiota bacterium]|nr:hypothetical protein [Verrucomicrobiales bacterium]HRI14892.1 TonB family protein [Verrucomicrobiota bacterium]
MDRTQQHCLAGSTAIHIGVLVLVLVASGLAAHRAIQPEVPFMEIIPTDLLLTMGNQIGGGKVNPLPPAPAPKEAPTPTPKVAVSEPVKPTPTPRIEPRLEPKPVEPTKPVERKVAVTREVREVQSPRAAQDVALTRQATKPVTTPKIQVSNQTRTRTDADKQVEREAREAAAAEAAARDQRMASVKKLASRITGAATGLAENVGSSTKIEMPGPEGIAYAPYLNWMQSYIYERWRRPATSSQEQQYVVLEVVIARDGTVLSATIIRPSGFRSLDASAETVFREYRKLRPLPGEYKEPRLVVPVKFVLEAPGSQ